MSILSELRDFHPSDQSFADIAAPTAAILTDLVSAAFPDGVPMQQALPVARVRQLVTTCAWTDAALALLALQQPQWKLRRLAYDSGEWHCALSRQPDVPDWLDQSVEAHHPNMALAIVSALVEIPVSRLPSHLGNVTTGQPDESFEPQLCDNFC